MNLEEEKQPLFPQEMFMRQQTERQEKPLIQQKENYGDFLKLEGSLINKIVVSDTFSKQSTEYESWEVARFYPGSTESATEIRGNWMPCVVEPTVNGLQIRSEILRSKQVIHLNSISCELKISFRLVGDSTFWILTRGSGVRDPDAVICKIKKEQETQRVFLIFGANIGKGNEFKFFKKQEFPEVFKAGDELLQDYVDMKLRFVDNGDDKVFVRAMLRKDKHIEMSCDKYIPCFRETPVMLAGSGDSVLLKNITVRQIPRTHGKPNISRYECCRIF